MGLQNLVLVALVVLAGVGMISIWNTTSSKTKEGFKEETTTDDDIDYFVAVSGAMKKHRGVDPSPSEVRRTVAEMRKKQVPLKEADSFVETRGGRVAIKEPMQGEEKTKEEKTKEEKDDAQEEKPAEKTPKPQRKAKKSEKPPAMSASVAERLTKELNSIADRIDDLVEEIAKYAQQPMDQPIQASVSEGFANFSSW